MNAPGRGGLDDAPYSYRPSSDGKVLISWRGRQATVLTGRDATKFLSRIVALNPPGRQLAMAKATGNFKRGNEKSG
jgi:hypothetical protein